MAVAAEEVQEKARKLEEVLAKYREQRGALIPVLQATQEIYGYLPREAVSRVARELRIPVSKVFGVATFYAQFHLTPRGRNIIRVCQGTACHVRGGAKILEAVQEELKIGPGGTTPDLRFTLEPVACLGCCGLAPVMMINEDTHGRLVKSKLPSILGQYT